MRAFHVKGPGEYGGWGPAAPHVSSPSLLITCHLWRNPARLQFPCSTPTGEMKYYNVPIDVNGGPEWEALCVASLYCPRFNDISASDNDWLWGPTILSLYQLGTCFVQISCQMVYGALAGATASYTGGDLTAVLLDHRPIHSHTHL